jgi:hypothetical protein
MTPLQTFTDVPSKIWWTSTSLHGVTFQKAVTYTVAAARNLHLRQEKCPLFTTSHEICVLFNFSAAISLRYTKTWLQGPRNRFHTYRLWERNRDRASFEIVLFLSPSNMTQFPLLQADFYVGFVEEGVASRGLKIISNRYRNNRFSEVRR